MVDYHDTRANEFDGLVGELQVRHALDRAHGQVAMELGCGIGWTTRLLAPRFKRIIAVDIDEAVIGKAKTDWYTYTPTDCEVEFVCADAEEYVSLALCDAIFMINILEHVNDPVATLRNAADSLAIHGKIHIVVPNAWSFHRVAAKRMGLIDDLKFLPEEQVERFGHRRVYDPSELREHIDSAGLRAENWGGIVFKPFSNKQMQAAIDDLSFSQKKTFVEYLYGYGLRDWKRCSSIYVEAVYDQVQ